MNWLDKLEKKFPRFGIRNITIYLVICNAIGYLMSDFGAGTFIEYLRFDMDKILVGQVWRFISWIFVPTSGSAITTLIFLLCAASWGRSLEQMLGTFRVTVFAIGGVIINIIGGVAFYFISKLIYGLPFIIISGGSNEVGLAGHSPELTTYFLILSILMEIAILYPEGIVRFWFILPMKMKWMLYLTLAELAFEVGRIFYIVFASYGISKGTVLVSLSYTIQVFFALINLLIFYLAQKNHVSHAHKKRQKEFHQQYQQAAPRPGSGITKHKCAVCGRTEVSNPELLFRYCSKCPSGLEYCSDHLFTHTHK